MSKTTTMTLAALEREVLDAHHNAESWLSTWRRINERVQELVGFNRRTYRRVYLHLLHLHCTGDEAGMEPPGSAPWEQDDAACEAAGGRGGPISGNE